MASYPKINNETEIGAETGARIVSEPVDSIKANTANEIVAKTLTDAPISSDMGADSFPETINRSMELISKLKTTAAESRRILQRTMLFYETNKMLESSKQLKSYTLNQLRRSRK